VSRSATSASASTGRRVRASASAARSTTAEYAVKISHSRVSAAVAASQRFLVWPARVAPASSRLPKLPSRSSKLAWIVSRCATAAATAARACSRVSAAVTGALTGTPPAAG
jgi:hypothetical protein